MAPSALPSNPNQKKRFPLPLPFVRFSPGSWFNEERFFLLLAIVIGVISGFAVVAFRLTIDLTQRFLLGSTPGRGRMIMVLVLVGLIVGALVLLVFPRARGSGVNQTKAALYIYDGYIPFRTAI